MEAIKIIEPALFSEYEDSQNKTEFYKKKSTTEVLKILIPIF